MSELLRRSALELAALVRGREVSARELVQASLDRIAAVDGQINAFTHVAAEAALVQADAIDAGGPAEDPGERPFAGVPIAIKDNRAVAGMPMTMGSAPFTDFVPRTDAYVVTRLRDAGFVIVGKTALPEFGILPTTESALHGATANPVGPGPHARWLERRVRRRGRRRDGPACPRQRRRRLDPHPGGLLRPGRPQAGPRGR